MADSKAPTPQTNGQAPPTPAAPKELSNAEKKKLAKAEKAAKRAAAKDGPDSGTSTPVNGESSGNVPVAAAPAVAPTAAEKAKGPAQQQTQKAGPSQPQQHKPAPTSQGSKQRRPSVAIAGVQVRDLPERLRRGSKSGQTTIEVKKGPAKEVSFFSHLYGQPRKHTIEGSAKEVHPAILELGLQLSSYVICGSQARCIAMLLALKCFITSYTTPPSTSLPRHLSSTALSPQLTHLKLSRPFSITQANSIRWLKNLIATIDPSTAEPAAKAHILTSIDTFIRERFTVADRVIAESAGDRIRDGDVVLTYAKSAVVVKTLLAAKKAGKKFRVVIADSRPLFEGKNLARTLAAAGIPVTYCMTSGLAHVIKDITICILGAHAILGNGGTYSRVGTALVGMMAKERGCPVVVCAESVKFTERVAMDAIVGNELAPEEELLFGVTAQQQNQHHSALTPSDNSSNNNNNYSSTGKSGAQKGNNSSKLNPDSKANPSADPSGGPTNEGALIAESMKDWRDKENLQVLHIMYDVLPPEYVDMVVTEHGCLPPGCAPIVGRMNVGG